MARIQSSVRRAYLCFRARTMAMLALLGWSMGVIAAAHATAVTYTFTTSGGDPIFAGLAAGEAARSLLGNATIVGSFVYDSSTAFSSTNPAPNTFSRYLNAISNLSGTVATVPSSTFAVGHGQVQVGNETYPSGPPSGQDFLVLVGNGSEVARTGILAGGSGLPYLFDVRIWWIEGQVGSDFLTNQNLPATLPVHLKAAIGLDFKFSPSDAEFGTVFYFGSTVQLAPVPEAGSWAYMVMSVPLLLMVARRRSRRSARRIAA